MQQENINYLYVIIIKNLFKRLICVLYMCTYIILLYYRTRCIVYIFYYKLHTYYIIIICNVRTQRGINHVIGLRKFIQSSTVDLYGPLGAKMFFFFIFTLTKENIASL